jgi:hypothetical protein
MAVGHAMASDLSGAAASPPAPPAKAGRAAAEWELSAITGQVKTIPKDRPRRAAPFPKSTKASRESFPKNFLAIAKKRLTQAGKYETLPLTKAKEGERKKEAKKSFKRQKKTLDTSGKV